MLRCTVGSDGRRYYFFNGKRISATEAATKNAKDSDCMRSKDRVKKTKEHHQEAEAKIDETKEKLYKEYQHLKTSHEVQSAQLERMKIDFQQSQDNLAAVKKDLDESRQHLQAAQVPGEKLQAAEMRQQELESQLKGLTEVLKGCKGELHRLDSDLKTRTEELRRATNDLNDTNVKLQGCGFENQENKAQLSLCHNEKNILSASESSLKQHQTQLMSQVGQLTQANQDLSGQLRLAKNKISNIQDQLDTVSQSNKHADAGLGKLSFQLSQMSTRSNDKLAKAAEETKVCRMELDQSSGQVQTLKHQLGQLRTSLTNCESSLSKCQKQTEKIQELELQNSTFSAGLKQTQGELETSRTKALKLSSELEIKVRDLNKCIGDGRNTDTKMSEMQTTIKSLRDEVANLGSQAGQIGGLQRQILDRDRQIEKHKQAEIVQEQIISGLRKEQQEYQGYMHQVAESTKENQQLREQVAKAADESNKRVGEIESELKRIYNETEQSKVSRDQIQSQLNTCIATGQKLKQTYDGLKASCKDSKDNEIKCQQDKTTLQSSFDSMKLQFDTLKMNCDNAIVDQVELNRALKSEDLTSSELAYYQRRQQVAQDELVKLSDDIGGFQSTIQDMKKQTDESTELSTKEKDALNAQVRMYAEQTDRLERQVEEFESNDNSKDEQITANANNFKMKFATGSYY